MPETRTSGTVFFMADNHSQQGGEVLSSFSQSPSERFRQRAQQRLHEAALTHNGRYALDDLASLIHTGDIVPGMAKRLTETQMVAKLLDGDGVVGTVRYTKGFAGTYTASITFGTVVSRVPVEPPGLNYEEVREHTVDASTVYNAAGYTHRGPADQVDGMPVTPNGTVPFEAPDDAKTIVEWAAWLMDRAWANTPTDATSPAIAE